MSDQPCFKPCPWCGSCKDLHVSEGTTFRWRWVTCGCGVNGPEVRHNTVKDDQVAAEIESTHRAIEAWNTRVP